MTMIINNNILSVFVFIWGAIATFQAHAFGECTIEGTLNAVDGLQSTTVRVETKVTGYTD
jgi:hypothetical protein